MKNKENIVTIDFQGWPVYKMSLREILNDLGFEVLSTEGNQYLRIRNDAPCLDIYPVTLEDDGMGYGVNEKYITCVDLQKDRCHMFIDKKLSDEEIQKYLES